MNYVGIGPRFVAALVDGIVLGIISSILSMVFGSESILGSLLGIVVALGYYIYLEGTRGQTLGKMAMGIKVVNASGGPITMQESVIRNLMRIIDALFIYLVAAISIWNSPTKQRLGDRVAHTYVIKASDAPAYR